METTSKGFIREFYFRTDFRETVFILESVDAGSVRQILATLLLVEHGLIAIDSLCRFCALVPKPVQLTSVKLSISGESDHDQAIKQLTGIKSQVNIGTSQMPKCKLE